MNRLSTRDLLASDMEPNAKVRAIGEHIRESVVELRGEKPNVFHITKRLELIADAMSPKEKS